MNTDAAFFALAGAGHYIAGKVRAIEFAQVLGAQWIEAGNAENNPMLQINLRLGFQLAPAWLSFEKRSFMQPSTS